MDHWKVQKIRKAGDGDGECYATVARVFHVYIYILYIHIRIDMYVYIDTCIHIYTYISYIDWHYVTEQKKMTAQELSSIR